MGESQDVLQVLVRDHREVERLFAAFDVSTDPVQQRELVDHMIIELVRHTIAEEEYLYPAIRKALPSGDAIADKEIAEHAEAERTMNALDGLSPDHTDFPLLVEQLEAEIRAHVREEEDVIFPQLEEVLPLEERKALGQKVVHAKEHAPTHPHPHAPDKPPFNKALAPGAALVDRIRDHLTGRGRQS
ncbi:hemerythrin domain-containing protein [Peterkaempfera bronchialis]|uniref:Hemerythrin domain-containing protein n=1 Tax=Peterkaempfera bronchialis TaxID=2126346 RepID=A0A345T3M3_9ACTN|nr:hemerythrin domain-containing protein [Peterkaempfera bronchialis]AXI80578.1 hemerythrin domain-containing protein [Peterkaempfera bronchialis]